MSSEEQEDVLEAPPALDEAELTSLLLAVEDENPSQALVRVLCEMVS